MSETTINNVVEPQTKKKGRPKKDVLYNEKGERLTKGGKSVDKRQFTSIENLKKSPLFQDIMTAKNARKQKVKAEKAGEVDDADDEKEEVVVEKKPVVEEYEIPESEDEADEFEIEEYVVKPKGKPQVVEVEVEKVIEKVVEKVVEKEVVKPDPKQAEKIRILEEGNKQMTSYMNLLRQLDNAGIRHSGVRY